MPFSAPAPRASPPPSTVSHPSGAGGHDPSPTIRPETASFANTRAKHSRYLLAENKFTKIDVYEQRAATGGVWNASPVTQEPGFTVPRTTPTTEHEHAVVVVVGEDGKSSPRAHVELVSPVYEQLETNIPHGLMRYTDLAFPDGTALFPEHTEVLAYLQRYGREVEPLVRFETQVQGVRKVDGQDGKRAWRLEIKDLKSGAVSSRLYDAVVAATGHYSDPFVPDIPGIKEFDAAHPGVIVHSKFYRRPEQFAGKVRISPQHTTQAVVC